MSTKWEDIKHYPSQHGERRREVYRKWYIKNGRNRAIDYIEAIREWIKNNPEKVSASRKVRLALKSGKITKPESCIDCQRVTRLSGHHPDYNKPLEVLWLCSSCHKLRHS